MNRSTKLLFAFSLGMLSWGSVCAAQDYEFKGGCPTPETARRVQDEQDYQRAVRPTGSSIPPSRWKAHSRHT